MAAPDENFCDLCQQRCEDAFIYAHKPYLFRFYHEKEYKDAFERFNDEQVNRLSDIENNNDIIILNDNSDRKWSSDGYRTSEENSDSGYLLSHHENDIDVGEDMSYDSHEFDSERELLLSSDDEANVDRKREDKYGKEGELSHEEIKELLLPIIRTPTYISEVSDINDNDECELSELGDNNSTDGETERHEVLIPSEEISSFLSEQTRRWERGLEFLLVTGVASSATMIFMTPICSTNFVTYLPRLEDLTTFFFVSIATIAISVMTGIREIVNAAREKCFELPVCNTCDKCALQGPGCHAFCEYCGQCEIDSYWKNGSKDEFCLLICDRCNVNCVICESNIATIKRHHKAFGKRVHGHLSTRLSGTHTKTRIIGCLLLNLGIIWYALLGYSWQLGMLFSIGGVIINIVARLILKPNIEIKCNNCQLQDVADNFNNAGEGCKRWCQCCGVFEDDDQTERYCLATCEECQDL